MFRVSVLLLDFSDFFILCPCIGMFRVLLIGLVLFGLVLFGFCEVDEDMVMRDLLTATKERTLHTRITSPVPLNSKYVNNEINYSLDFTEMNETIL